MPDELVTKVEGVELFSQTKFYAVSLVKTMH